MKTPEKWTKTECALLAVTLLFLLGTGAAFLQRSGEERADYTVRTEGVVALPPEETGSTEEDLPPDLEPPTAAHPLDINTASAAELELLPGIGPALAERIVAYRTENGAFAQTGDLRNVKGIGEETYADLAELITVGEAET